MIAKIRVELGGDEAMAQAKQKAKKGKKAEPVVTGGKKGKSKKKK
jgi:hypothetical protein